MVDVIRDGEVVTVSERQALAEELFVLRIHEKKSPMESLPSIESRRRVTKSIPLGPVKAPPRWHSYQADYLKNNVTKELVDNFHWEITKARKSRNLTRLQLANTLNVPEHAIKLLETGELPSDDFILINKVQHFLGINLRRDGKTFGSSFTPSNTFSSRGPAYVDKPDFKRADLSLADLQKLKEAREKARRPAEATPVNPSGELAGNDIELFD